jgi:hypothetical protein
VVDNCPSVVTTSPVDALTPLLSALVGNATPLFIYLNCLNPALGLAPVGC